MNGNTATSTTSRGEYHQAKHWELEALVRFMRTAGVQKVRLGGLEVELGPAPVTTTLAQDLESGDPMPSETELELWSSGLEPVPPGEMED